MKLFLDDERMPPDHSWTVARTADEAIEYLKTGQVEHLSLDHDLGEPKCDTCEGSCERPCPCQCHRAKTGMDVVKFMVANNVWPKEKPKVHSANVVGRANMQSDIDRYWPGGQFGTT